MNGRLIAAAGCILLIRIACPAGAQVAAPPAAAAAQEPPAFERTPPYGEGAARRGHVIRLSAHEAVDLAVRHNLDIAIERYAREFALRRVVSARGYYDPALSVGGALSSASSPLTGVSGGDRIPSDQVDVLGFNPSLRQNITGGGNVAISLTNTRTTTSSTGATVNPIMASVLNATLTQPLARGFLATAAERQLDVARLDVDLAASQFRQKATQVVQQVLGQYWELQYALAVYDARRQSKDLALVQYEAAKLRVQSGLLPPVALTSARAEIASRERDLLQAEVQIIGAENALKLLISQDPASPLWQTTVMATDTPAPIEREIDLAATIQLAAARRPELEQLRLQGVQNAVDRRFLRREKLPTVNLTASVTSAGRAGTVFAKDGNVRFADPTNPTFGGFSRSWNQVFGFEFPGWGLGVNVQVPLRNRTAAAQLDQADLARDRLQTLATRTEQSVMVDVRNTVQVIATQRKSLEAARLTTQLFAEQLEAQTARYEANFSNDFELRRFQRDLVDARVRELRALVDLQVATIALARATDMLLDDYGVPPALVPRPAPR